MTATVSIPAVKSGVIGISLFATTITGTAVEPNARLVGLEYSSGYGQSRRPERSNDQHEIVLPSLAITTIAEEPESSQAQSPASLIQEIRKSTALTWDQLARLFGVSRRAAHLWAAGGKMNGSNLELLSEIASLVSSLPGTSPTERKANLLLPRSNGRSLYDEIRSRHASRPDDINRSYEPGPEGAVHE